MKAIGIVAEYNPFHYGHLHHIKKSKERTKEPCAVVCVMTGNFMQRGDAAICNKHARASMAVSCGADLVLELPLPWSLSSAEGFAQGSVALLGALGVVQEMSFGSENGTISDLSCIAHTLLTEQYDRELRKALQQPISYAAARNLAVEALLGDGAKALKQPNNILAIEYIKAIHMQNLNIQPVTFLRKGSMHDGMGTGIFRSASELRQMLTEDTDISPYMPPSAYQILANEKNHGRMPVTTRQLESAMLSRLRLLTKAQWNALPDAAEGLGNRFYEAAQRKCSVDEILSHVKTKRYALSRLRRMLFCACTGVTADMTKGTPPYARVLAASPQGCHLLYLMKKTATVPIITKPADISKHAPALQSLFMLERMATDLYVLGYPAPEERYGGSDFTTSPTIIAPNESRI